MQLDERSFWQDEQSSLRTSEIYLPDIFRRKAEDFASLFSMEEKKTSAIDIGCGAGEILEYLMEQINVKEGIDISKHLIDNVRLRLSGRDIKFQVADALEYAPTIKHEVWFTAGAINQYLNEKDLGKFIDIFITNENSKSVFLFDTIDPAKYILMNSLLISYRPEQVKNARHQFLRTAYSTARLCLQNILGSKDYFALKEKMGFAYRPRFWMKIAEKNKLSLEIVSSRYMEYRYHVLLRK